MGVCILGWALKPLGKATNTIPYYSSYSIPSFDPAEVYPLLVFLLPFLVLSRNSPRELKVSCPEQARRLVHVVQAFSSKCLLRKHLAWKGIVGMEQERKDIAPFLSIVKQVPHCYPDLSGWWQLIESWFWLMHSICTGRWWWGVASLMWQSAPCSLQCIQTSCHQWQVKPCHSLQAWRIRCPLFLPVNMPTHWEGGMSKVLFHHGAWRGSSHHCWREGGNYFLHCSCLCTVLPAIPMPLLQLS